MILAGSENNSMANNCKERELHQVVSPVMEADLPVLCH